MPNLEVKCSKEMESFFLENDGELLRKLHALLKDHKSLDPVTEEPKNTVLRNRVATTLAPWLSALWAMKKLPASGFL